jgi:DNA topoisomerase VI subunit B
MAPALKATVTPDYASGGFLLAMQVGVFVSIVSTKIPFKGAGKEYIGDDVEEMVGAVKAAIQQCCAQLRVSGAGSYTKHSHAAAAVCVCQVHLLTLMCVLAFGQVT